MILSDQDIRSRLESGTLKIEPLEPGNIQPASIDIRLGAKLLMFAFETTTIDPLQKPDMAELDFNDCPPVCSDCHQPCAILLSWQEGDVSSCCRADWERYYDMQPGEFILGSTLEYFEFPNDLVGRIEGRSSIGRLGLLVHVTAGYIDPGFRGFLTLELCNLSQRSFRLRIGMGIGQVSFHTMTSPSENSYHGRYQDQDGVVGSRYHIDT